MEEKIIRTLNNYAQENETFGFLVVVFARFALWLSVIATIVFWFFYAGDTGLIWYQELSFIAVITAVIWAVSEGIKLLTKLKRPFLVLEQVTPLVHTLQKYSFPSGHTTLLCSLAIFMFIENKMLGTMLGVLALMVGVARVAAGVHWPRDIIVSCMLSLVLFFGMIYTITMVVPV